MGETPRRSMTRYRFAIAQRLVEKTALAPLYPLPASGEGRRSVALAGWGSSGLISNQARYYLQNQFYCSCIGVLCHYIDVLCHYIDLLCHYIGVLCHCIDLLCHYIDLLCHYIGLLCHYIGLLCHYIGLLCHYIGLPACSNSNSTSSSDRF